MLGVSASWVVTAFGLLESLRPRRLTMERTLKQIEESLRETRRKLDEMEKLIARLRERTDVATGGQCTSHKTTQDGKLPPTNLGRELIW